VDATLLVGPFRAILDLDAKVEVAGRRNGIVDVIIPFWTFVALNILHPAETVVADLFLAFIAVPVNFCTGVAVIAALVGWRAGVEAAVPGREEDAALVLAPGAAVPLVTVGGRETDRVPGKGRTERVAVLPAVEGVTVRLAPTPVLAPGPLLGGIDLDGLDMKRSGLSSSV